MGCIGATHKKRKFSCFPDLVSQHNMQKVSIIIFQILYPESIVHAKQLALFHIIM